MKAELPELRHCCFCIPLRPGLLVWGYLRLVFLVLFITSIIASLVENKKNSLGDAQVQGQFFYILAMIADACLTIVYLIGGHRKNAKLLYVSFMGNIVLLCYQTLIFIWTSCLHLQRFRNLGVFDDLKSIQTIAVSLSLLQGLLGTGIFILGTLTYVIILLHSEINKIKKHSNYRVANTAVEVENGTTEYGFSLKETNTE